MSMKVELWLRQGCLALVLAGTAGLSLTPALASRAQTSAAPAPAAGRVSGTVTAIAGNVLTVKDEKGVESKVAVSDTTKLLQLPAGSKSLANATPIKIEDIAVGDRILAKTTPAGDGFAASTLVAMKQADIAQKQQHDREDWQTRGVSGVVKSVDPAASTVTISTGAGATAKALVVQASKTTTIRRYAQDSVKFDDAKAATLDQIHAGDQLRARGDKNSDGTELAAEDIIAGTFRNIAGTVLSVDADKVTVNDLATKKPFVVTVNADTQLHKLSPVVAQGMAARLKGGAGGGGGQKGASAARDSGGGGQHAGGGAGAPAEANGGRPSPGAGGAPGTTGTPETGGAPGAAGARGGDLQQMLNRAPVLQIADLKKGDAVMVLTTEGEAPGAATAITLLAGVEPLLQASPGASQSVLSASWNLGGGGAGGQDAQ